MSIEVKRYICGPVMTNAFVVFDSQSKKGFILDPAPGSLDKILTYIKEAEIKIECILLTHSHWDHIAECKPLKEALHVKIYVHKEDRANLEVPGSDLLLQRISIQGVDADEELYEGQEIQIGSLKARVLHTPGHSPGSICLYFEEQKTLFSGDTLFKGGYGTLDVATAQKERMQKSLHRLKGLAKDTLVYCGHGPTTTIGAESWLENF